MSEAMDQIEREVNFKDDFIIVLSHEDWHPGVLGIVASKIADRFYRPAIIISLQDEVGRGSARSVHNFHIYEALIQCEGFLKEFGGHKYAAGLTIDRKNIKEFKTLLNTIARASFQEGTLAPVLEIRVWGFAGWFLHYLMCIYRSISFKNRFGVFCDAFLK